MPSFWPGLRKFSLRFSRALSISSHRSDADNSLLDERFQETARAIAEGILATVWSAA